MTGMFAEEKQLNVSTVLHSWLLNA